MSSQAKGTRREITELMGQPQTGLDSSDPSLRRLAVAAAAGRPDLVRRITLLLGNDPDAMVRRECAEVLGATPQADRQSLLEALADTDPVVREAAAVALGEVVDTASVPRLVEVAIDPDEDSLVREAAVAALGAIGDPAAVPTLLDLITSGPPQVRRRCVPALTVFDDDRIEPALRRAARDRNPMVREAAEMVVGRAVD